METDWKASSKIHEVSSDESQHTKLVHQYQSTNNSKNSDQHLIPGFRKSGILQQDQA